jgi:hypothetical protein
VLVRGTLRLAVPPHLCNTTHRVTGRLPLIRLNLSPFDWFGIFPSANLILQFWPIWSPRRGSPKIGEPLLHMICPNIFHPIGSPYSRWIILVLFSLMILSRSLRSTQNGGARHNPLENTCHNFDAQCNAQCNAHHRRRGESGGSLRIPESRNVTPF